MDIDNLLFAAMAGFAYSLGMAEKVIEGLNDRDKLEKCAKLHAKFDELYVGLIKIRTILTTRSERFRYFNTPPPPAFFSLVRRFSDKAATDSRDKLFALLGIADASHSEVHRIVPDYKMSFLDVYLAFARAHLTKRKTLDILNECCGPKRPDEFP